MGTCFSSPKKPEMPAAGDKYRIDDKQAGPADNQEIEIRKPRRDKEPDQPKSICYLLS